MKNNKIILFQGDSITDCHRDRDDINSLGDGYVSILNNLLSNLGVDFINKGIAGDTTKKIKNRWIADCLDLKPDFLCLYAGVNDTWFRYQYGTETTIEQFEENFIYLLDTFKEKYPDVPILLISPFIIPMESVFDTWFEDLQPKINLIKHLSDKYKTDYIALQEVFNQKLKENPNTSYWVLDGVHPTLEGHKVIAEVCYDIIKLKLN